MSMKLMVVGTFKNGKRRVAGYHSSYNKVITKQDLNELQIKIESEIYPVIEKFKKITVSCNMSYNATLKPALKENIVVRNKYDIQTELIKLTNKMNSSINNA